MEFTNAVKKALQNLERPTIHELIMAIQSLGCLQDKVARSITEPKHLGYGRNVIFRNDHVEAIVIHLPGQRKTSIHDHGASFGCALVIEGELQNVQYLLDLQGYPVVHSQKTVGSDQILVEAGSQIHQMVNEKQERVVSLHVYAPPLNKMSVYLDYSDVLDFVI